MSVRSITPFLWFDACAEEAAHFYVSLFPDSRIRQVSHYSEGGPRPAGTVMLVDFELQGWRFNALNGGPVFHLSEAFSVSVECSEQADIDRLWRELGEGGSYNVCGWLKDRFGLSWQISYAGLPAMLAGDGARSARVMTALMQMTRIDVRALEDAAAGVGLEQT